ncbi:hypothetical protein bpr_I1630 [Butyrivibrio proteoclasticus B316]|uniref:Uncharacterized protein n=1 Tax=Butyrivibrio proteoclasticus (strain ATCC 51982 / DSM 14932 / B316) TaxID=515622 RepID=E0RWJ3_BUTPB|nr:hypothetical protein [Butyrivibrio proteoclasticus]ADL34367.1 hypothetical protein bpr_I1630 [Butyrivibrio proteoclasticus B316]
MKFHSDEELAGIDNISTDDFAQSMADDVNGGKIRNSTYSYIKDMLDT